MGSRNSIYPSLNGQSSACVNDISMKGKGKGVLGKKSFRCERNARGGARKEGGKRLPGQETIVFLIINIYQANVKILIGQNLIRSK